MPPFVYTVITASLTSL